MKNYLIGVLVLAMAVVMASGCITDTGNQTNIATKNYSAGGISFQYPEAWNLSAVSDGNQSILTITDTEFTQTNGTKGSVVIIFKVAKTPDINVQQAKADLLAQTKTSNGTSTNGTINVNGITANEAVYTGTDQGQPFYIRLVDFEKNNNLYLLLFAAGGGANQETAKANFNVILNSFKVE